MLKWLILLDNLVLAIFALVVMMISKFVHFFEIEMELTIIAVVCFSQFAFSGIQFIYVVKDRLPDTAMAKRMVIWVSLFRSPNLELTLKTHFFVVFKLIGK